jgi:hypothetical protein
MTNVMHKFLIYLSIYFCLTCFGLSFSPFSEAGVQHRQWFKSSGYGVSARVLSSYPGFTILIYYDAGQQNINFCHIIKKAIIVFWWVEEP